jgi:IS5 family transposase
LEEKGMELILRESIRVNGDDSNAPHLNVDTTVQEKNITFHTDTKLQKKIIDNCLKIAKKYTLRQTYTRTLKRLMVGLRFSKHPRNKNKAKKARKKIKVIAGRLVRELLSKLGFLIAAYIVLSIKLQACYHQHLFRKYSKRQH